MYFDGLNFDITSHSSFIFVARKKDVAATQDKYRLFTWEM